MSCLTIGEFAHAGKLGRSGAAHEREVDGALLKRFEGGGRVAPADAPGFARNLTTDEFRAHFHNNSGSSARRKQNTRRRPGSMRRRLTSTRRIRISSALPGKNLHKTCCKSNLVGVSYTLREATSRPRRSRLAYWTL